MKITAAVLGAIGHRGLFAGASPPWAWSATARRSSAAISVSPLADLNALFDTLASGHAVRQVVIS